jgi:hypothetical protein
MKVGDRVDDMSPSGLKVGYVDAMLVRDMNAPIRKVEV